jgi:RNA polymerase sigma-70 factor (ECF subfamily)
VWHTPLHDTCHPEGARLEQEVPLGHNRTGPHGVCTASDERDDDAVMRFEQFYETTWRRLFRSLVVITTDRADAEDVLQDAFVKAARDWHEVAAMRSPEAWVRRVAVNAAMDLHRRKKRQRGAYQRLGPAPDHVDDLSLEVMDALSALPMAERQVVVLHHLLSLSVEEISEELGRPSGTVKTQLVRGRRRLAELLRLDVGVTAHE